MWACLYGLKLLISCEYWYCFTSLLVLVFGIGLMLLRIIIRQWSIAVLGGFFSSTVGTQKGQKVVDKGPY